LSICQKLGKMTESKLSKLIGITTSQINQALKADNPYPARVFLKEDCATCQGEKRPCFHSYPTTDTPVFFRIKEKDNWIRPKIPKGSLMELEGHWSQGQDDNFRSSFTATNYRLISNHCNYCRGRKFIHKGFCPYYIADKINEGITQQTSQERKVSQIISQSLFNHYNEEHKSCQPSNCEILKKWVRENYNSPKSKNGK